MQECMGPHLVSKASIKAYGERGLQGPLSATFIEVCTGFAPLVSVSVSVSVSASVSASASASASASVSARCSLLFLYQRHRPCPHLHL